MAGISSRQGSHHVAQKFRSTTLPRRSPSPERGPVWRGDAELGGRLAAAEPREPERLGRLLGRCRATGHRSASASAPVRAIRVARSSAPVGAGVTGPRGAGGHVRGDPLEDGEMLRPRRVDEELVDPGLAVAAHHVLEGTDARPRVGEPLLLHLGRPAVERPPDRPRIAADRRAVLVEDRGSARASRPGCRTSSTRRRIPRRSGACGTCGRPASAEGAAAGSDSDGRGRPSAGSTFPANVSLAVAQEPVDDLDGLVEAAHQLAGRREAGCRTARARGRTTRRRARARAGRSTRGRRSSPRGRGGRGGGTCCS